MNSFYTESELTTLGLKSFGRNVLISKKACLYTPSQISLGNDVRIDDFCILSGIITLGSNIHIGAYSALYGKFGIIMEDYTGLSPRCTIFSATDDFSGDYLISPMQEAKYTHVTGGIVTIKRFSQLGSGCVIFPYLTINEGVAVGAMSLINKDLKEWGIYAGIPAKFIKERKRGLLNFF